ncbi:MAG: hypothetical protein ABSC33_20065 [Candidatus Sulfotelmatobacter sp.]|jgi:putative copper export protein
MELLLNIAWLLLAVPGYWLWRRGADARLARRVTSLQFLLALGCVLVLLFPVISATDDLHAMRTEMEESATSKRAVRHVGSEKSSGWLNRLQGPLALAASAVWLPAPEIAPSDLPIICLTPLASTCILRAGRAPPVTFPG